MKDCFLVFMSVIALAACGEDKASVPAPVVKTQEEILREVVTASLKDPESARFGKISYERDYACVSVNARNSFGGYTGEQQAYLLKNNGKWVTLMVRDVSHDVCVGVIKSRQADVSK